MKRRESPEPRPERLPWVRCNLEGLPGTWTFRLPRDGVAKRLAAAWADTASLEETENIAGAIVGAAWADEQWALESNPSDGAAVMDELYDAGWSSAHVILLAGKISEMVALRQPATEEVEALVDFFGATPVQDAPGNCSSAPDIAEEPTTMTG